MDTRKIQEVGGGTYTVSIPVHWADEHGVEAGTTAYLYTHRDGSLVVRWNEKEHSELASTDVELDDPAPAAAERLLRAAYAVGYERIRLHNPDGLPTAQRRAIHTCTRRLTGVEITGDTDHAVTVKGMLDASDVSIRQSTIQLQYLTLSMYEAALECVAGETTDPDHVVDRADEADRVLRLVTRHFNRSLLDLAELDRLDITRPQLFEYYGTARQFERIADHAVTIARCGSRSGDAVPEALAADMRTIGADARQVVEAASSAVVNGESTASAQSALDGRDRVIRDARRLDRTLLDRSPDAACTVTRVLDSIVRTAECGGNIAEQALHTSLRA